MSLSRSHFQEFIFKYAYDLAVKYKIFDPIGCPLGRNSFVNKQRN